MVKVSSGAPVHLWSVSSELITVDCTLMRTKVIVDRLLWQRLVTETGTVPETVWFWVRLKTVWMCSVSVFQPWTSSAPDDAGISASSTGARSSKRFMALSCGGMGGWPREDARKTARIETGGVGQLPARQCARWR